MLSNKSIKILINYVAGPLLFTGVSISLYHQWQAQTDIRAAASELWHTMHAGGYLLPVMILLMVPLNWGLEAKKWQLLIKSLEPISWFRAMKGVMAGVAFSVTTPNRIGEYGGRMLFLKEGHRLQSVPLTLVGSGAQLLITLFMGCVALLYLRTFLFTDGGALHAVFINTLLLVTPLIALLGLLLYFKVNRIVDRLAGLNRLRVISRYIAVLKNLSRRQLFTILWLSFLRYLVFTLQYVWLLQWLGVESSIIQGFFLTAFLFLLLAFYPTFALLELLLRQELAILIFGMISTKHLAIMAASAGIWIINLVVPAIIGSCFLITVRIFRN